METKKGLKPGSLTSKLVTSSGMNAQGKSMFKKESKVTVELVGQDKVVLKMSYFTDVILKDILECVGGKWNGDGYSLDISSLPTM